MPRDQNGNTVPLPGTIVANGDTILPSQHNPMVSDLYAMMGQSLSRDGQGGMRAPLAMNGFRVEGVGTAISDSDAVSLGQSRANGVLVGTIHDWCGQTVPETYLFAHGQAVSRSAYPVLFAAIGTSFGGGDGATTFNLPDTRGRVLAGRDTEASSVLAAFFGAVSRTIGSFLGSASHVLTLQESPSHFHTGVTSSEGNHQHSFPSPAAGNAQGGSSSYTGGPISRLTDFAGLHSHSFQTNSQGGGSAHTNTQPTLIVNKIIKATY